VIQDHPNPRVRAHLAHIRPDVQMGGLLKETPNSQLFTVFGAPRTSLDRATDGSFRVTMEGVDIYNPIENSIVPTRADKVALARSDSGSAQRGVSPVGAPHNRSNRDGEPGATAQEVE
jgi:adenine-specific DNA-methyltransferase